MNGYSKAFTRPYLWGGGLLRKGRLIGHNEKIQNTFTALDSIVSSISSRIIFLCPSQFQKKNVLLMVQKSSEPTTCDVEND